MVNNFKFSFTLAWLKKYKYVLFVLLLIIVHLLFNHYSFYKISGFNHRSYKYLYVSFTSIIILTALFYCLVKYYKSFDKYFYYTFLCYFFVLFTVSLLYYPFIPNGDTPYFIEAFKVGYIIDPYYFGFMLYYSMFWLTANPYFIVLLQLILVSFTFAYFTSFAAQYVTNWYIIIFNCLFVLNLYFLQSSLCIQQNVPANYLIVFLSFFIFKAFLKNTLRTKKSLNIIYVLSIITSLTRPETIVILPTCFFIIFLYCKRFKVNGSIRKYNLIIFLISIFLLFVIKVSDPDHKNEEVFTYKGLLYESMIRAVINNPNYNLDADNKVKKVVNILYKGVDYKHASIKSMHSFKSSDGRIINSREFVTRVDTHVLRNTALKLVFQHPIVYLKVQLDRFNFANKNPYQFPLPHALGGTNILKDKAILLNKFTRILNLNGMYLACVILIISLLMYRTFHYTAYVAILILSSKVIVFLFSEEANYAVYTALNYSIFIIPLMLILESKFNKQQKCSQNK